MLAAKPSQSRSDSIDSDSEGPVLEVPSHIVQLPRGLGLDEASVSSRRQQRTLKQQLKSSLKGNTGTGAQHSAQPYVEWDHEEYLEQQYNMDMNMYDYDFGDDISEAESEFTEDYSRHNHMLDDGNEEESSLSSEEGSYLGLEFDDGESLSSAGDASSAADSRKLSKSKFVESSDYKGHLLAEENSEFSEEEDPLFNASGTIRLFTPPQNLVGAEEWSDEEDMHTTTASLSDSQVWKEESDGTWVTDPTHMPPPTSLLLGRQESTKSAGSDGSDDSFADEQSHTLNQVGAPNIQKGSTFPKRPASHPLQPDKNLMFDDSDDEEERKGFVLTEDEIREKGGPPVLPTLLEDVQVGSDGVSGLQFHDQSNLPPNTGTREEAFSRLSLSPMEFVAPLKDHSTRPRKNRAAKTLSSPPSKPSKKKKKKDKKKPKGDTDMDENSVISGVDLLPEPGNAPQHEGDMDGDYSVASECSNDSMDAVGVSRASRRNGTSPSKRSKKPSKKKKKEESSKKRGRRIDFEEDSPNGVGPNFKIVVADRVEAIFSDKQSILNYPTESISIPTPLEPAYQNEPIGDVGELDLGAEVKSSYKVKSKASEEHSTSRHSKSKHRSRSMSKDPATRHRGKSKDSGIDGRSRSKSRTPTTKKISSRSRSTGRLRKKEKKDTHDGYASQSETNEVASYLKVPPVGMGGIATSSTLEQQLQLVAGYESSAISVVGDSGTVVSGSTQITTQTAPADIVIDQNGEKVKRRGVRRAKSTNVKKGKDGTGKKSAKSSKSVSEPESPVVRKGANVLPQLVSPSRNVITLNDVLDRDGDTSDDESLGQYNGSPRRKVQISPKLGGIKERLAHSASSIENSGGIGDVPFENGSIVRLGIEKLKRKLEEVAIRTQNDLKELRRDFEKKKATIAAEVASENENNGPTEAILCLHKLLVNEYHSQGRHMKKEMKMLRREISEEISTSVDLMKELDEWRTKVNNKQLEVSILQRENVRHAMMARQYESELHDLHVEYQNSFGMLSTVEIGSVEDYDIETQAPLFLKWRKPEMKSNDRGLDMSYRLPKKSIFYNILNDDEYKLSFSK